MRTFLVLVVLCLSGCTLQTDLPPTLTPTSKIVRAVIDTATPTATWTPSPTALATVQPFTATPTTSPTETRIPTATPLPTRTPTLVPTRSPYAPQAFLGGARRIPRRQLLNVRAPADLEISPALFGINYWVPPFGDKVKARIGALNLTVLRWGGENLELEPLEWKDLDRFILDARAVNAEPLIQVPYAGKDPAFAAKIVRYVNVQKKYDVRFWSIGNEEDNNLRGGAKEKWINSWRSFRDAMKAVDPRIILFGPDYAQAYEFTDPTNDWLTPFLQVNGNVVDVISLHRYPFNGGQTNPTVLVGDAFDTARRVRALRAHIRWVTGREIPIVFTEMNLSHNWREGGEGSSASFSAGLWMAETLGQMAEAGVFMVNVWNARSNDSLGILTKHDEERRPTYYAMQLYANYGDRLVPLASHVTNVAAHAARDSRTGNVSIVLVNRGRADASFQLVFNSGEEQKQGAIYFDLNSHKRLDFDLPAQSMASLALDKNSNVTGSTLFSRDMFNSGRGPVYSTEMP